MKSLLVIANVHHASPRIPALMFYLSDSDWKITIVTPNPGDNSDEVLGFPQGFLDKVKLAVAPYRGDVFWPIRKILRLFGFSNQSSYTEQLKESAPAGRTWVDALMRIVQVFVAIPDTEWPWYRSAFKVAGDVLQSDDYDVLFSSSPFPTVHRVASKLKDIYGIPWVADFRDPWSSSHNATLPVFRQKIDRWLEKRTVTNADLITTVSSGVAEKLVSLHGERVHVVRNGFQPVSDRQDAVLPDIFTVRYTGTIYEGKQDPAKILRAIKLLLDNGEIASSDFMLEFYGRYNSRLQQTIHDFDLSMMVNQKGAVAREEIRKLQMSTHMLLLLQWEDLSEKGIFPLKFYEYLDARRPILATGGDSESELAEILEETGAGTTAADVDEIAAVLKRAYREFSSTRTLTYSGNVTVINNYSYEGAARGLKELLEKRLIADA